MKTTKDSMSTGCCHHWGFCRGMEAGVDAISWETFGGAGKERLQSVVPSPGRRPQRWCCGGMIGTVAAGLAPHVGSQAHI